MTWLLVLAALWQDATMTTIGTTAGWSNKVELADIDGDGRVDILFPNGGDYEAPGAPELSQVFRNDPVMGFVDVSAQVFGSEGLSRVIQVRDLDGDGDADIVL